ncbi:hypothetical protein niasHT_018066 [Heterodera trifolii]|uniref:Uncharacterized protein n=1 Tax=Heterodera trifolii TaxID=157864 RepID=A0ABD2LLX3_9BILA
MKSDDFLRMTTRLCVVLGRDTLRVEESVQGGLSGEGLQPNPDNFRLVLGSALSKIRFPLISPSDFATLVAPTKAAEGQIGMERTAGNKLALSIHAREQQRKILRRTDKCRK